MNTLTLQVGGMSCMGCVNSVKDRVSTLPGVAQVEVALDAGRVTVLHDPAAVDAAAITQAIERAGFQVVAPPAAA